MINEDKIQKLYEKLKKDTESSGYHLNPDNEFVKELIIGMLENEKRFGYLSCPCRLSTGNKEEDLDIICPCDYRDSDLEKYGTCYCALYVSEKVIKGEQKIKSIPESRRRKEKTTSLNLLSLPLPVWRCKVCGYLCARPEPPGVCPICKVTKDRFEKFI